MEEKNLHLVVGTSSVLSTSTPQPAYDPSKDSALKGVVMAGNKYCPAGTVKYVDPKTAKEFVERGLATYVPEPVSDIPEEGLGLPEVPVVEETPAEPGETAAPVQSESEKVTDGDKLAPANEKPAQVTASKSAANKPANKK